MTPDSEPANPEDTDWMDQYPPEVQKILRRTPEEKAARVWEVMRESKILMLENLYTAGFYSREELNRLTWDMLLDPKLSEDQRKRIQVIRDANHK